MTPGSWTRPRNRPTPPPGVSRSRQTPPSTAPMTPGSSPQPRPLPRRLPQRPLPPRPDRRIPVGLPGRLTSATAATVDPKGSEEGGGQQPPPSSCGIRLRRGSKVRAVQVRTGSVPRDDPLYARIPWWWTRGFAATVGSRQTGRRGDSHADMHLSRSLYRANLILSLIRSRNSPWSSFVGSVDTPG
jgi:hypothetical protein